jgi:hypothetical protein
MHSPFGFTIARMLGRVFGISIVLVPASLIVKAASAYWWLQVLLGCWSVPFIALGLVGGAALGQALAERVYRIDQSAIEEESDESNMKGAPLS